MGKVTFGPQPWVYPMPPLLIGANVDGKPNFMPCSWCGIANGEPPMLSIAIRHTRYTHHGLLQNMTFSASIANTNMVKETDYCGFTSGAKVDKVAVCRFKVFYGKLGNAPMIEQCPVNIECQVVHVLDLGSHSLFVGKIEEVHVSESCISDGKPDIDKIDPLVYLGLPMRHYHSLGKSIAKGYSVGEALKAREQALSKKK